MRNKSNLPSFFNLCMVYVLTYWIHPSCNSSLLKRLKIYKTLMGYGFNASSHYPSFAFQSRSEWSFRLPCNHLPAQLIFSERSPERLPGCSPAQPGWRGLAGEAPPLPAPWPPQLGQPRQWPHQQRQPQRPRMRQQRGSGWGGQATWQVGEGRREKKNPIQWGKKIKFPSQSRRGN